MTEDKETRLDETRSDEGSAPSADTVKQPTTDCGEGDGQTPPLDEHEQRVEEKLAALDQPKATPPQTEAESEQPAAPVVAAASAVHTPSRQSFDPPEKKKFPTWAIVLIVVGVISFLGLCCTVSALVFADEFLDGLDDASIVEFEGDISTQDFMFDLEQALAEPVVVDGITHFESIFCEILEEDGIWIVLVWATLPEGASLPATVEIAVPTRASVYWFGEIDAEADDIEESIDFERPYQFRAEGDFDVYTATLTQFHDIHIEYTLDYNPIKQGSAGESLMVEYVPWQDIPYLWLAATLPKGALLSENAEFSGVRPDGRQAFSRLIRDARAGQRYSTEFTWTFR
ncbi:MAG: hypothetical protein FWF11_02015 [Coriobacteriia bacterium]|nr:hypothetical protein [Coriobacteriia bacterium]